MEYIQDHSAKRWTSEQFAIAAKQFGRFNGAYLAGRPLPDAEYFCKNAVRDWANTFPPTEDWIWENDYVSRVFSGALRKRVMRLWDERERFFDVLDRLPKTFLHGDSQRRNLFIRVRPDGTRDVVAADWANFGIGALGTDLFFLVGPSAFLFEIEAPDLPIVEAEAFDAYLAGLREAGWTGETELLRLAYCTMFGIWSGPSTPPLAARWTRYRPEQIPQLFGRTPEQLATDVSVLCEYALDRADEARELMVQLL